ncbi:Mo-co oxidoreductase dimerisation domain-containing protein [Geodermatophilus amargosae]|uniref:Mo-co oxidoreductase dimerisation domain-containing protein n=1 Tax=Geodermatophilus amargosae TaxID=1296565 RepID=A0A1I7AJV8_9ACTN|nr:sulfite oxidase [Geodermatophilus amargosae]SFT75222.1 Mo-co oxidoreductase dimerisation domain-containing protein [Geodermatophilus amargosae]
MTTTEPTSRGRARIAGPGEGIGLDELALATRNHGLPLEALRYDVTPPGLHYVLTHYDIPAADPAGWRLEVTGAVGRPLRLDLDALRRRPAVTARVLLECAGNGRARLEPRPVSQPWLLEAVGNAEWTGTPLAPLLEEAGLSPDAVDVVFTGADHGIERGVEQDYARGLPLAEAMRPDVLVVWAVNGAPLPPQHGAPLRLLVPGWYGMAHVKWLTRIEVLDRPFDGFQNATAYRLKTEAHEAGVPVTRIAPRALLTPPGFPDFMTRERFLHPGLVTLTGRAWSGRAPLTGVEVSTDGGTTWTAADLAPADPAHPYAWRAWTCAWDARPGSSELVVRAADAEGPQPVEQPWNRQGMANNLVQRVPVTVLAS